MHGIWDDIVLGGVLKSAGMISFADVLSPQDSQDIQAYVIKRAHDELKHRQGTQ